MTKGLDKYVALIALVGMACAFGLGWMAHAATTSRELRAFRSMKAGLKAGWAKKRVRGKFVKATKPAHFEKPKPPFGEQP